jgi:hypothetical protein
MTKREKKRKVLGVSGEHADASSKITTVYRALLCHILQQAGHPASSCSPREYVTLTQGPQPHQGGARTRTWGPDPGREFEKGLVNQVRLNPPCFHHISPTAVGLPSNMALPGLRTLVLTSALTSLGLDFPQPTSKADLCRSWKGCWLTDGTRGLWSPLGLPLAHSATWSNSPHLSEPPCAHYPA